MSGIDERDYQRQRGNQALDVLAAILALPKHANGLRVPRVSIEARLRDRIKVSEDPISGDLILSLEPER